MRITGESLKDQRVLFLGAGSAGIGIADMIRSAMKLEGLSEEQARSRIWLFDVNGLLENTRKDLIPEQEVYLISTLQLTIWLRQLTLSSPAF
jgi:malate dehydrogenase (oxaloacetate-decarboxylating)(NADP+)